MFSCIPLLLWGPGRTPMMISWRKYVGTYDEDVIRLKVPSTEIRFSYLQPNEVLSPEIFLNKQIVDTRGIRVVRVNDLQAFRIPAQHSFAFWAQKLAHAVCCAAFLPIHLVTRIVRYGHPMQDSIIA